SEGWGFKSLRAHHIINRLYLFLRFFLFLGHGFGHGSTQTASIHGFSKMSWCEVRVPHSRLNITVPEDLLHRYEIDACHDTAAGCGVSEGVPTGSLDSRSPQARLKG